MVKIRSAVLICLAFVVLSIFPVGAVSFLEASNSVYLLNDGQPFSSTGHHIWNDGSTVSATGRYLTSGFEFTSNTFKPSTNGLVFACNKLSSSIYLIPGYVYTVKFTMRSQFFDGNDNRINPSKMSILFAYEVGNGAFAMCQTTALPVVLLLIVWMVMTLLFLFLLLNLIPLVAV